MFSMHTQLVNHLKYNHYPPVDLTGNQLAEVMEAVEDVATWSEGEDRARQVSGRMVEAYHLDFFVEWFEQVQTLCHDCERDMDVWDMLPHYLDRGLCMSCINKQEGD